MIARTIRLSDYPTQSQETRSITVPDTSMVPKKAAKTKSLKSVITRNLFAGSANLCAAVVEWLSAGTPKGRLRFDDQPALGRAILTLNALSVNLAAGGTLDFLRAAGSEALRLPKHAKLIGAVEAEKYAAAMIEELRLLNGGQLAADTREAMSEAIGRVERAKSARGAGPFAAIDKQFAKAVPPEIDQHLRTFVREQMEEIEHAYALGGGTGPAIPPVATADEHGHAYFSPDPKAYDERARAWLKRAEKLTAAEYAEVAKRYRKGEAYRVVRKLLHALGEGPYVGRPERDWKPEYMTTLRLSADVERKLMSMLASSALTPVVQRKALEAYERAAAALRFLPELERVEWGADALATTLGPFEGFIPPWNANW